MKIKHRMINVPYYCKNSMALLRMLQREFTSKHKTFVVYGDNPEFDCNQLIPNRWYNIICIARHKTEYKGFVECCMRIDNQ